MKNKFKTIGILGGMGPLASANLYKKIVEIAQYEFNAEQDYEFPPMIIYSLPLTDFDETGFVDEKSVLKQLLVGTQKLEQAGADFIIIACNTVHYFQDQLQQNLRIPIISIIDEAINEAENSKIKKVGLLTSHSTRELRIYEEKLREKGIGSISVSSSQQEQINNLILDTMGGHITKQDKQKLVLIANDLRKRGAEGIIIGCTELPLIINSDDLKMKTFDTLEILARVALKNAYENG